ncbi:MAG TPA: hypothetical protein VJB96_00125 [Patescibacteria group bacterium]|nr:hypothetical protein [Patescibacteria group bacterium]
MHQPTVMQRSERTCADCKLYKKSDALTKTTADLKKGETRGYRLCHGRTRFDTITRSSAACIALEQFTPIDAPSSKLSAKTTRRAITHPTTAPPAPIRQKTQTDEGEVGIRFDGHMRTPDDCQSCGATREVYLEKTNRGNEERIPFKIVRIPVCGVAFLKVLQNGGTCANPGQRVPVRLDTQL